MTTKATTTTTTNVGADGFERTALILGGDSSGSFDILDGAGNLIARINAFAFEAGHADIDILLCPDTESVTEKAPRGPGTVVARSHPTHDNQATVITFERGTQKRHKLSESESGVVALDFHYPTEGV